MTRKTCTCGAADVTYSDHVSRAGNAVIVHALGVHCYTYSVIIRIGESA